MGLVTLIFDVLTLKRHASMRVGNHNSEFGHTRLSGSPVIRYVRDGRTDGWSDGRTKTTLNAPFPTGESLINMGIRGIKTSEYDVVVLTEIVDRVRFGGDNGSSYRPDLRSIKCEEAVSRCIQDCWSDDPEIRPDFKYCRVRLKSMQKGLYVITTSQFLCFFFCPYSLTSSFHEP